MAEMAAESRSRVLCRFSRLSSNRQMTVMLVGVKGIGKHRLAQTLVNLKAHLHLQVRTATHLPLPHDSQDERPRIDFVVFLVDLTNRMSFEVVENAVKILDTDYFLGRCCFVMTNSWKKSLKCVEELDVMSLADMYDSPILTSSTQSENERLYLAEKIISQLEIACGLKSDVTPLLIDCTRKAFEFEGTYEVTS